MPGKIKVTRTRTVGPRNRQTPRIRKKKGKVQSCKYTNTRQGQKNQEKIQKITI